MSNKWNAYSASQDGEELRRAWPSFAISVGLHLTVCLIVLLWPTKQAGGPIERHTIKVSLIDLPPRSVAKPVPPTPEQPAAKPAPAKPDDTPVPKPIARKPVTRKPVKTAAKPQPRPTQMVRPKPTPTPTPKPDQVAILRKYPEFNSLSEDDLRHLELPPGVNNWDEFAKIAKDIGMFQGNIPPPTTGNMPQGSDIGSEPTWNWREDDGEQIGECTWWGGRATITWRRGDAAAAGYIIPNVPSPSPVPYEVPVTPQSDRESVATVVIRVLREFESAGDKHILNDTPGVIH